MFALMLHMDGAEIIEISRDNTSGDISRLVGDPFFDRISVITG